MAAQWFVDAPGVTTIGIGPIDSSDLLLMNVILSSGFINQSPWWQMRLVDMLQSPAARSLLFFAAAQQVLPNRSQYHYFTRRGLEQLGFRVIFQI